MMSDAWNILYYEIINGECPVQEFIDHQNRRNQAKILSFLTLLEERGPTLPRPYADLLQEGIHELRINRFSEKQVKEQFNEEI